MRLRSQFVWTFVIQGSGAVALLAGIVLIGYAMGPAAQGLFSRIKSEVEFIAALALFGMPASVQFYLTSQRLDLRTALRTAFAAGAVAIPISLVYLLFTRSGSPLYGALFALACAAFVVHSILRVIVLAKSTTVMFNVVTTLPQVVLFGLIVIAVLLGVMTPDWVGVMFLASFLLGCALALWLLPSIHGRPPIEATQARLSEMISYGAATAVASALNAGSTLLWVRHCELSGLAAVGIFTMGLALVQVAVTPFNYVAPLLFKHWVELPNQPKVKPALLSGLATFIVIVFALQLVDLLPASVSLGSYAQLLDLKWIFAAAAVAEVLVRVPLSAVYAAGRPWLFPMAEAVRITILIGALLIASDRTMVATVSWWAIAAAAAAATLLLSVARMGQPPVQSISFPAMMSAPNQHGEAGPP